MNARLQRWQLFFRVLATLGLLLLLWRSDGLEWPPVAAVLVFWLHAPVVLVNFLALKWINRREAPTWSALLLAWLRELWVLEQVFTWQQPFASQRWPDRSQGGTQQHPVLFIHGYTCNRGLWNGWLRQLHGQGCALQALTLEPAFGSIDDYVEPIEQAMRALEAACPGLPPIIVAHSMGGLAVRAWLRRHGRAGRVLRVLTLGTPHGGTLLARYGRGQNSREMRWQSDWLADLAAAETPETSALFDCYFSRCDQIVCPVQTARLPGARSIELQARGHLGLVFDPRVQRDLQSLLTRAWPV